MIFLKIHTKGKCYFPSPAIASDTPSAMPCRRSRAATYYEVAISFKLARPAAPLSYGVCYDAVHAATLRRFYAPLPIRGVSRAFLLLRCLLKYFAASPASISFFSMLTLPRHGPRHYHAGRAAPRQRAQIFARGGLPPGQAGRAKASPRR